MRLGGLEGGRGDCSLFSKSDWGRGRGDQSRRPDCLAWGHATDITDILPLILDLQLPPSSSLSAQSHVHIKGGSYTKQSVGN